MKRRRAGRSTRNVSAVIVVGIASTALVWAGLVWAATGNPRLLWPVSELISVTVVLSLLVWLISTLEDTPPTVTRDDD